MAAESSPGPSKMTTVQRIPFLNDLWRSFMVYNLNPEELDLRRPGECDVDSPQPASAAANLLVWRRSNMRVLVVLFAWSIAFKISGFSARISEIEERASPIEDGVDILCTNVCDSTSNATDSALSACSNAEAAMDKIVAANISTDLPLASNSSTGLQRKQGEVVEKLQTALQDASVALKTIGQVCLRVKRTVDCYDMCTQQILRLVENRTAFLGTVDEGVDTFARYQFAQTFLAAYDLGIEVLSCLLAILGAWRWSAYPDSVKALGAAFLFKTVGPFAITFLPIYAIFGIGPVASVHPQMIGYRLDLSLQIYRSITGIFISTIPTVAYAGWVLLSLIPASGFWALFLFATPFLNLLVIWPASVIIVQFLGDWGCAIGFSLTSLSCFLYYPPAYAIMAAPGSHNDYYALFSKWYNLALYTRIAGYVVLGIFGILLIQEIRNELFPDRETDIARLVPLLLTIDSFNSYLVVPYAMYYLCILVYVDAGIGLCAVMRKRDGYLASEAILTQLCGLRHGEVTSDGRCISTKEVAPQLDTDQVTSDGVCISTKDVAPQLDKDQVLPAEPERPIVFI
eukprot:TRINITY_DN21472_c0_g1_i2.p1 TRINITY_DN21472_c0_g1~~TRINITY_DN21472_c0_g1_i2.p1  ORF type:complete len:587 (-),score=30.37 TRINITY_DN21472_c0_g1_i2:63-1772(-)